MPVRFRVLPVTITPRHADSVASRNFLTTSPVLLTILMFLLQFSEEGTQVTWLFQK